MGTENQAPMNLQIIDLMWALRLDQEQTLISLGSR
jgi:hypothetical protein